MENGLVTIGAVKIFLSGNFTDTGPDIEYIYREFKGTGFDVNVKFGNDGPPSAEMIEDCDVFVCVVGLELGAIVTANGDTLPQIELNEAIRRNKKVVPIIKSPDAKSANARQQDIRDTLLARYGKDVLRYDTRDGLALIVNLILTTGFERHARVLMPLRGFISYSHKDRPIAHDIARRLMMAGYPVFLDNHDIGVGDRLSDTLQEAIHSVGYVVLCLSRHSFESEWMRREIGWTLEASRRFKFGDRNFILPAKVGDFTWPDEFSELSEILYADVHANFEVGLAKLIAEIMRS